MPFLNATDPGVVGFPYFDPCIDKVVCWVFVLFCFDLRRCTDFFDFAYLILGSAVDSALAYLAYRQSVEINRSCVNGMLRCFP